MKKIFIASILVISPIAFSQEVGVKVNNIPANQDDTTISISKGAAKNKKQYTISEGAEEISGDQDVMKNIAQSKWKKACTDWKIEFKDLNKQNSIISMSCGKMNCEKDGIQYVCSSHAVFKVRVLAVE